MRITFKNVGQGDSIILEWVNNNQPRLGIVDCNTFQKTNPTVQHLQKVGCKKIDFIILSHPHDDHFSGMLQLLEFCEMQNIPILTFAHTAQVDPRYLKYANLNSDDSALLGKIFQKAKTLYENKQINGLGFIGQNTTIPLNQDFVLQALAPSNFEIDKFTRQIDYYNEKNDSQCSKAANFLSTVIKISNKKEACLLTSDAEKDTFERLQERHSDEFEDLLSIAQIPHHGSKNNHYPLFWSNLKRKPNCIAAVSTSGQYQHPNVDLMSDFSSWGYATHSTNRMESFSKSSQIKVSTLLDMISELIEDINTEGDLIFEMTST